jgi:hypothetical protein
MKTNIDNIDIEVNIRDCEEILKRINEVGRNNFLVHDISEVGIFKDWFEIKNRKIIKNNFEKDPTNKIILTNFLYLNAVMDQGRDPEGVRQLLVRVTNLLYSKDINFLHEPEKFFKNTIFISNILQDEHKEVKKIRKPETGISSYSLFDTKINPYTMHRWGTVMLCLKKLKESKLNLLEFIKRAGYAEKASVIIRNDNEFGLGNAIGYKASRLLIKWLIHTFKVINENNQRWGPNSFELPLDSNVGGILMRSGYIFAFTTPDELWNSRCWIKQPDGRINLSAQRLRDLDIIVEKNFKKTMKEMLSQWGRINKLNIMRTINTFVYNFLKDGMNISIGQLDDGFMHIGKHCINTDIPNCNDCDINDICLANTKVNVLKFKYYCGTGQGVFY